MAEPYYITTPIYYVTDAPHIGHLYTTVAGDIQARYHRLLGRDVWYLTGTDEHGQKIEKKAKENNETPKALADRVVERYRDAWKVYGIQYDDFIRTTEERHKKVVTRYVQALMETGDIYLSEYEGWYCVPDETYWTETQLKDGKCPDCGRTVERLKEESYFFRMSKYEKALLEHIEKNPDFIFPESRKNEVLGFIRQGLKDISISRTTIQWGIPMPKDSKAGKQHCIYVWFDALTNYLSALDPLEKSEKYQKYWTSAIHLVGKDILRFHAVYWPTFLLALKLPLPKRIVAHGWLTESNRKISKSLGNAIEPIQLAKDYGVDSMRYFLFREFVFGQDGEYTQEIMLHRINSDLANDFGNCINRTCNMLQKYLGTGDVSVTEALAIDSDVRKVATEVPTLYHQELENFGYNRALEAVWKIISGVNKYIDTMAPWSLAKSGTEADLKKLNQVLIHCHEGLRIASLLLLPFIPTSAEKALGFLGDTESQKQKDVLRSKTGWGTGPKVVRVIKGDPLFPRLETKK